MQNRVVAKAAGDLSDFGVDWREALLLINEGEEIQASMWVLLSGDVVINPTEAQVDTLPGTTHDAYITSVWGRAGTPGTVSILKNTITTNHGRVFEDTVSIEVQDVVDRTLASRYTSLIEIEHMFGRHNLAQWLRIEDEDVHTINERLSMHMEYADETVDSTLLGGVLATPFTDPVPSLIRSATTMIAGVSVYEARGIIDVNSVTDQPMHRLASHKKRADLLLRRIRCGRQRVTGATMIVNTHPVVEDIYAPSREPTQQDLIDYLWPAH